MEASFGFFVDQVATSMHAKANALIKHSLQVRLMVCVFWRQMGI